MSLMEKLTFQLKDEFIELNKLLKVMGLCESSGAGKALVASGDVRVNGQVELRKACSGGGGYLGRRCHHSHRSEIATNPSEQRRIAEEIS